jgi:predicted RNase H-related nuclease YkuK (DUF458 family)
MVLIILGENMFSGEKIRDFSGNEYSEEELLEKIKEYCKKGFDVYIGSDTQKVKEYINLVIAICFVKNGDTSESGKIFYSKSWF